LPIKNDNDMDNKSELLKRFGQQLKKVRLEKGITAAELGRLTFIDKPHITRLEKGGTNPTLTTLIKLADALDIELHELFEGYFFKKGKGK
jgi:transcriptional regulator with XRE-family HTH domain